MEDVRKIDPRKSCRRYIFLNDQLSDRKIVPQEHLSEAGYVSKFVEFTQFEYPNSYGSRKLLKCPVTYGERKEPRNMYLLPIHYENSAKLPQLFTFFENPRNPEKVNVYTLSPVPPNVDEVDFNIMDENLVDLTGVPSTSNPHQSRTSSDLEILRTSSSDSDTAFLPTGPVDSDTASLTSSPVDSDTAHPITGPVFTHTDSLPTFTAFPDLKGR